MAQGFRVFKHAHWELMGVHPKAPDGSFGKEATLETGP